jgi:hypothetical protein
MAINFPNSPSDGDTVTVGTKTYSYNASKGVWKDIAGNDTTQSTLDNYLEVANSSSIGVTTYSALSDLPMSGQTTGKLAFVSGTNRLYIWNGTGWYNIALINTSPSISGASSFYSLNTDGSNTVVTLVASDPEGLPISFTASHTGLGVGANAIATVTQSNNIFTFTPTTNTALAGTFTTTFTASDGVNIAGANSSFTLAFAVNNSNYTTALITSVGTNNQVNNTFVDSSTNSHTITAAGNVTQNTFSPYRHGGYSTYFDGSGDYLQVPQAAAARGTGDYTIECWVYSKTFANEKFIFDARSAASPIDDFMTINSSGYLFFRSNGTTTTTTQQMSVNTWHHFAQVRNGSTLKVYVDGVEVASKTQSANLSIASAFDIGGSSNDGASATIDGYIADFRIVLGTAVYTSAFTPPTERLTAITNTSLLTCHLPYIADGSTNGHAITINGNTKTEPFSPYDYSTYSAAGNGGSMYFDGTGDYLTASPTAPGTGDFCYECWINVPQASDDAVFETRDSNNNASGFTLTVLDSSTIRIYSNSAKVTASGLSYLNQWTHLCVEKVGSTTTLYVNGTSFGTTTDFSNMSDTNFRIGESQHYGAFSGHITDFRYVRGGYVYNGNFTPPTSPLTAISGTELLINGTNAGIIDKSQTAKTLTLNGDVKSSTTQTKYLSSSIIFDGNGDYIDIPLQDQFEFGTGDFTVEFWFNYDSAVSVYRPIQLGQGVNGVGSKYCGWAVRIDSPNLMFERFDGTHTSYTFGSISTSAGSWHHLAITRSGTTLRGFVDGTQIGSDITSSLSFDAYNTDPLRIGFGNDGRGNFYWDGYMSDIRITKGLARYTANFTPPTSALQG